MNYEIIKYPDSQINVKIEVFDPIIQMRINSYKDLFVLKSISDVYKYNNKELSKLVIPCLFGQRSDRRFVDNESFGLKLICDFINSFKFEKVEIFDTHSDVSLALINKSHKISSFSYVKDSISSITNGFLIDRMNNLVLVSPDAGAYKKVFKYVEELNLPLVAANKFRDLQGNITLNISGNVQNKTCLIVDDLLDAGYTFHLLAKQLKEQGASKVYLYISHAYFNKGVDFTKYIDGFYFTNSVKDIDDPKVTQFKII